MAFPTIPTRAAGRLVSNTQANTTATRTFPAMSGLTKNAGDLLIAICVAYQTSTGTNAAFSGWSDGFTEFHDSATSTTMAVGMAYKWSTGSETAAPTVTQAGTITGHAAMILLSIPGAHPSTPPEAGSRASGTGAADPASFNPSNWDVEDTLWIAVAGNGETGTGGTWTGLASAPTNYTSYDDTGLSGDAVGTVEAAVAFRQNAVASEDVGPFTGDTSNARDAVVVVAVRPVAPTQTSVAEVSLASAGTPVTQTNHKIKVRARTTAGAGTIKAALYEGATNRSGDLESSALTTSLADYTLSIPDANAANITDYSNLSIRFWGYAASGGSIVFEVDQLWLETPEASSPTGSSTFPITFTVGSAGTPKAYGAATTPFTLGVSTAGTPTAYGASAVPVTFTVGSAGTSLPKASSTVPVTFTVGSAGTPKAYGSSTSSFTVGVSSAGTPKAYGASAVPITFGVVSIGGVGLHRSSSSTYTLGIDSAGTPKAYGAATTPFTFGVSSSGTPTAYGASASTYTLGVGSAGTPTAYGVSAVPITFGVTSSGTAAAAPRIAAAGLVYLFGDNDNAGTFGFSEVDLTFEVSSSGTPKAYASASMQTTVNVSSSGTVPGSGSATTDFTFGVSSAGTPKAYGSSAVTVTVGVVSAGSFTPRGSSTVPITFGVSATGAPTVYAASATVISFNVDSAGVGEITTGMFDDTGPGSGSYDEPSPSGSLYDAPALTGAMFDEPSPS